MSVNVAAERYHAQVNLLSPEDISTSDFGFSLSSDPAAGNTQVLFWSAKVSSGTNVSASCSVTDTKGNTWVLRAKVVSGTHWAMIATTDQAVGALTTADTITVHTGTAGKITAFNAWVEGLSAIDAAPTDVSATSTGTSTAPATGTTAATAQDDEVVLALLSVLSSQVVTKDAGYLAFPTSSQSVGGTSLSAMPFYKLTAGLGTGAQSAIGALGASAAWIGLIVTLKGTGVAPPANQINFADGSAYTWTLDANGNIATLTQVNPAVPPSAQTPHPDYPAAVGYQLTFGVLGTYSFDIDTAGVVTNLTKIL